MAMTLDELKQALTTTTTVNVPSTAADLLPPKGNNLNDLAEEYVRNHWDGAVHDFVAAMNGTVAPSPSGHPRIDAVKFAIHVKNDCTTNGYRALGQLTEYDLMHHLSVAVKRATGASFGTLLARGGLIKRIETVEAREKREAAATHAAAAQGLAE